MKDNYGDKIEVGADGGNTIYLYMTEAVGSRGVVCDGDATLSHAYTAKKARKLAAKLVAAADEIDPPVAAIERVETNDGRFVPKVWLDGDVAVSHYRSSGGRIIGPSGVRLLRLGVWCDEDGQTQCRSGEGFANRHYSLVERDGKPVAA